MKEKELKKLSRLELLELLLDASTENHELKERIEKLNAELDTARHIEQLSTAIDQMEQALEKVNHLSVAPIAPAESSVKPYEAPVLEEAPDLTLLDKEIYRRLLIFLADSTPCLAALPLELQYAVKQRLPYVTNKTD